MNETTTMERPADTSRGMPFESVVQRLKAEQKNRLDVVLNTRRHVSVDTAADDGVALVVEAPEVGLQHRRFGITDHAHTQIAQHAGIPVRYYRRMLDEQPGLLTANVHTWWNEKPTERLARMLDVPPRDEYVASVLGEPRLRGWLSDQYRVLDNYDFMLAALEAAREFGATVHSAHVDDNRLYIKVLTPQERAIEQGDVVRQGAVFSNSEVGDGALQVQVYVYRLVCQNGLVAPAKYRQVHLGGGKDVGVLSRDTIAKEAEAVMGKVRDWTRYALEPSNLEDIVARFQTAKREGVDVPARHAVANVVRTAGLSNREADSVLEHYLRGNDDSQFGVVNAVTRTADAVGSTSYARRTELEELGGTLLDMAGEKMGRLLRRPISEKAVDAAFSTN